jgi:hypothetical protein
MHLLEHEFRTIEQQHQAYLTSLPAHHFPLDAAPRPVCLADLVQVYWQAGVPTLLLAPNLPEPLALACLACPHHVRAARWPRRPRVWERWGHQLLAAGKWVVRRRGRGLARF